MANTSVYLLGAGTLSQNTLQNSSTYVVTSFPTQSDQLIYNGFGWQMTLENVVKEGARVRALNQSVGVFGLDSGALVFKVLTRGMLNYLWQNIFNASYSAAVTFQVPHQRDGWLVYNATLEWCNLPQDAELGRPYVANVKFPFAGAVAISAGSGFDSGFDSGFG